MPNSTYPRTTVAAVIAGLAGGIASAVITALVVTSITIGGGTAITKHVYSTTSINVDSIGAGHSTSSLVTVSGVATGDAIEVSVFGNWSGATSSVNVIGAATATDTVQLTFTNVSTTAVNLTTATYGISAWRH